MTRLLARAEFDARADAVLSSPLDRSHPLWEIHLAPRLEDGSVGLVMKIHHAMVDGKSALAVALLLLDLDPECARARAAGGGVGRGPGARTGSAGGRSAGRVGGGAAARAGPGGARGGLPAAARRDAAAGGARGRRGRRALGALVVPQPARSGRGGRSSATRWRCERLLDVKHAWGGSLNDVALTVVAGALRQLALLRRVAPAPMKVMVPVSRRGEARGGGRWATGSRSCSSRCRCTCAIRSRGWRRSARRPRRSRSPSARAAARR